MDAKLDKLFNKNITEVSCTHHHKMCCTNMDCISVQHPLSLFLSKILLKEMQI